MLPVRSAHQRGGHIFLHARARAPNGARCAPDHGRRSPSCSRSSRILCPIDFSEYSRQAISRAVALAGEYSGTITALHVVTQAVPPRPPDLPVLYPPIVFTPDDLEQFRTHTRQFVEQQNDGAPIDVIVAVGNTATEIVRVAEELPADMIVIGTHGRSGFDRLMLGSVTERILRRVRCPVLTVPRRHGSDWVYPKRLFTRILCATDFSASSRKALSFADSIAERANAELTVIHVVELMPTFEPAVIGLPDEKNYRVAGHGGRAGTAPRRACRARGAESARWRSRHERKAVSWRFCGWPRSSRAT